MPKNALKVIENDLLYSEKKVLLPDNKDRRDEQTAAGEDADDRTDENLNQRIAKFQNQLKKTYCYRILLKYLVDNGLVEHTN